MIQNSNNHVNRERTLQREKIQALATKRAMSIPCLNARKAEIGQRKPRVAIFLHKRRNKPMSEPAVSTNDMPIIIIDTVGLQVGSSQKQSIQPESTPRTKRRIMRETKTFVYIGIQVYRVNMFTVFIMFDTVGNQI